MRFKGTITEWNDDRGFGFISPAEVGERVFCHINAFEDRSRRPSLHSHAGVASARRNERIAARYAPLAVVRGGRERTLGAPGLRLVLATRNEQILDYVKQGFLRVIRI